jgi:hypothetical protein
VVYSFSSGESTSLPGVYVSESPISFIPSNVGGSGYIGAFYSAGWYSGGAMIDSEFGYSLLSDPSCPEPGTLLLLSMGAMAVVLFRQRRAANID